MAEGSLYDRELAAIAIKQARGDMIEAVFLVRAYRTTLPRFAASLPIDTAGMSLRRRISATLQDLPGGQLLGPTFDYTHRLLDLGDEHDAEAPLESGDGDLEAAPRVADILGRDGLIESEEDSDRPIGDLTRAPLTYPAERDLRLQSLARGDEGFLLALAYSTQRGYGRTHPFAGEIRVGFVEVEVFMEDLGFSVVVGEIEVTEVQMINQFKGSDSAPPQFTPRLRPHLRLLRAQGHGDGAGRPFAALARTGRGQRRRARAGRGVRPGPCRQRAGHRLRRASEAAALRRFPIGAGAGAPLAPGGAGAGSGSRRMTEPAHDPGYNFAFLDEQTKRMIRRAILKAIAIPGYQVPFASREMPMPYGWGTGGVQVTAALLGPDDVLKVIDQGADDTTNAVSIRAFFKRTAGVATTERTEEATIIQTRHPHSRDGAGRAPSAGLPGADTRAAAFPGAARDRNPNHARPPGLRLDAREALRGHRHPRPHRHDLCLPGQGGGALRDGPLAHAEVR